MKSTPEFELFLLTKEVALLSFASEFSSFDLGRFEILSNEMIAKCKVLLPEFEIYPKIHHLAHYGELIQIFGPLYLYSTFRFVYYHLQQSINCCHHILGTKGNISTGR